ncbi:GntR family transcriptional regulator [Micromonospora polyrhachis]|uniref:GntR family transcriptional regulator n=1 Tax=Micromonospora polyrhachis TaxID=1282883 RepID=A0A7W7SR55_9ACTN|nr:winged helix-turn-helix domain-containing protein [Micromonospora polyrhachis]MBB4959452.1 GntR family transcriptional regulator [Micromonospora polyrhachis]
MIDPRRDRALYRQLADLLREQIDSGELPPGSPLPSETTLAQTHGLARPAVRQAIALLRAEGLVTTSRGYGTRVREQVERTPLELPASSFAIARMPSDAERLEHDLDDGVPVLEIQLPDGSTSVHPGDRIRLTRP